MSTQPSGSLRSGPSASSGSVVILPLEPGRYYAQWIEVDGEADRDRHACDCGHRSDWAPIGSGQLNLAIAAHPATEDH